LGGTDLGGGNGFLTADCTCGACLITGPEGGNGFGLLPMRGILIAPHVNDHQPIERPHQHKRNGNNQPGDNTPQRATAPA
jgi:hypothetical protein